MKIAKQLKYLHSIGDLEKQAMAIFEKALEKSHTDSHTGSDL